MKLSLDTMKRLSRMYAMDSEKNSLLRPDELEDSRHLILAEITTKVLKSSGKNEDELITDFSQKYSVLLSGNNPFSDEELGKANIDPEGFLKFLEDK